MKRKNLFLALALVGSALSSSAAMAQSCLSCADTAPAQFVQATQQMQAPGRAIAIPGDQGDVKRADCCPPVTKDPLLLKTSFYQHRLTGENATQHYGEHYVPNPIFDNQMKLWAPYAVTAYAAPGWTGYAIVMGGEMKTDNPANVAVNYSTWPFMNNWSPTAADFAAGASLKTSFMSAWWWNSSAPLHFNSAFDDQSPGWANPGYHMTTDGRRYMLGISYYIYERRNGSDQWRIRKIDCGKDMQLNWRDNFSSAKLAAGAKPNGESTISVGKLNTADSLPIDPMLVEQTKRIAAPPASN
jgi:hypothetical protein